jgi:hypothetical protein
MREKLIKIQSGLKAPKNQRNSFGNYNYRSCEDILEAVKPLLLENKCSLVVEDEIVLIGDRYYIKAIATLLDNESDKQIVVSAFARESEEKKGMDSAQITGATSSYARKYALNGLFLIDDTKDSDTDEFTKETKKDIKEDKKTQETQKNESEKPKKTIDEVLQTLTYEQYNKLSEADKLRIKNAICKKNDLPFINSEEIKQYLK